MTRPMEEIVASQRQMIDRLGARGASLAREDLARGLEAHREETLAWLTASSAHAIHRNRLPCPDRRSPAPLIERVVGIYRARELAQRSGNGGRDRPELASTTSSLTAEKTQSQGLVEQQRATRLARVSPTEAHAPKGGRQFEQCENGSEEARTFQRARFYRIRREMQLRQPNLPEVAPVVDKRRSKPFADKPVVAAVPVGTRA